MTPDVNILVAAAARDHQHHVEASAWLESIVRGESTQGSLSLLPMVASGFVRVVTNPRVFAQPTSTANAFAFLRQLLSLPGVRMLPLGAEWTNFEELCARVDVRGNDVSDAWIAAAVLHHREHLATFDRGFRRFLGRRSLSILGGAR
jgi:uncharacterized protein